MFLIINFIVDRSVPTRVTSNIVERATAEISLEDRMAYDRVSGNALNEAVKAVLNFYFDRVLAVLLATFVFNVIGITSLVALKSTQRGPQWSEPRGRR